MKDLIKYMLDHPFATILLGSFTISGVKGIVSSCLEKLNNTSKPRIFIIIENTKKK